MHTLVAKFERGQNIEDYERVKEAHNKLKNDYHLAPKDMEVNIDVSSVMRSAFGEFPQIAQNEYALDQMQLVHAAEENLNANIENEHLAFVLVDQVQSVSKSLESQYKDYWSSPFAKQ
jgi:hypothetical protein